MSWYNIGTDGENKRPQVILPISERDFINQYMIITSNASIIKQIQLSECDTFLQNGGRITNATLFYDHTLMSGIIFATDYIAGEVLFFEFSERYEHPCKLELDSGWKLTNSSNQPSGYSVYVRSVRFERDLTDEEVLHLEYSLTLERTMGRLFSFGTAKAMRNGIGSYSFRVELDSSD